MNDKHNPLGIKILMFYEGLEKNNATSRALRALKSNLEGKDAKVIVSETPLDARAVIASDPELQSVLLHYNETMNNVRASSAIFCSICAAVIMRCRSFFFPTVIKLRLFPRIFWTKSAILSGYWKIPLILLPAAFWLPPNVIANLSCRRCSKLWPSFPKFMNILGTRRGTPAEPVS